MQTKSQRHSLVLYDDDGEIAARMCWYEEPRIYVDYLWCETPEFVKKIFYAFIQRFPANLIYFEHFPDNTPMANFVQRRHAQPTEHGYCINTAKSRIWSRLQQEVSHARHRRKHVSG